VQNEHDRFRTALQVELLQYRINRYVLLAGDEAADFQASTKEIKLTEEATENRNRPALIDRSDNAGIFRATR
jgi:hypothetical protein